MVKGNRREIGVSIVSGNEPLILASASPARAALLHGAGLDFETRPSHVDETELKITKKLEGSENVALALAELKAAHIAAEMPGKLVIGADQLLDCGGDWLDKARDRQDARRQLKLLRGRAHHLATAVCVMRGSSVLWCYVGAPRLQMRDFSDEFVEHYLNAAAGEAYGCVGAYRLEGLGAQLFDKIEGDYFTILGLPLLPLLGFLRSRGLLVS